MAAALRQACADGLRSRGRGGRADHGCALRGECIGDGRADASAGAGDEGDFALQWQ